MTPLAEIRDYDGLIDALRARKAELQLSNAVVDELAGLPSGYTGKLFGGGRVKNLGPLSFGLMLQVMAVKLTIVEDADAAARMQERYEKRIDNRVMNGNCSKPLGMRSIAKRFRASFVESGRRGGKARAANQTPEQRRTSARKAARARWNKKRSFKGTRTHDERNQPKPVVHSKGSI